MNPEATHLIAGGLGRTMAKWLVSRRTRHLILLSRSGSSTPEAKALLTQLQKTGIHIEAPCCDVANPTALRDVINRCKDNIPPIKGCIQASVVLTVREFPAVQISELKLIQPSGTHLPKDEL